jgi:hypothetical protein
LTLQFDFHIQISTHSNAAKIAKDKGMDKTF